MPTSSLKIPKWSDQGPPNQWRFADGKVDYARVIKENEGLIVWAMKRCGVTKLGNDVIENSAQELKVQLCRAAELYDPTKTKWGTYATRALFNYIVRIIREKSKLKNSLTHLSVLKQEPKTLITKKRHTTTSEEAELIQYLMQSLDERTRIAVHSYYIEGMLLREIGRLIQPPVTKERARQIILNGINKLKVLAAEQGCSVDFNKSGASMPDEIEETVEPTEELATELTVESSDQEPEIETVEDELIEDESTELIAPVKTRTFYEFSNLVEDNGKVLCPECGSPAGSKTGIQGLYTHLRREHGILAKINGVPTVTRGPRKPKPPVVETRTYNLIQRTTIPPVEEKQVEELPEESETLKEVPTEFRSQYEEPPLIKDGPALFNFSDDPVPQTEYDTLASAIIDLNNRLKAILLDKNVEYMNKSYVDGMVTTQNLMAEILNPFIQGIDPITIKTQGR